MITSNEAAEQYEFLEQEALNEEQKRLFRIAYQWGFKQSEEVLKENETLRQTLTFYAEPKNWIKEIDQYMGFRSEFPSKMDKDEGTLAREILKKS